MGGGIPARVCADDGSGRRRAFPLVEALGVERVNAALVALYPHSRVVRGVALLDRYASRQIGVIRVRPVADVGAVL